MVEMTQAVHWVDAGALLWRIFRLFAGVNKNGPRWARFAFGAASAVQSSPSSSSPSSWDMTATIAWCSAASSRWTLSS